MLAQYIDMQFEAIGTRWRIRSGDDLLDTEVVHLEKSIMRRIDAFDAAYSRFRTDS